MSARKQTRVQAVIALLRKRKYQRVPLPELQREAGAQHGARLREIRDMGYVVDNEMEHTADGQVHSWYVLRAEPGEVVSPSLFGDLRREPGREPKSLQYPD